MALISSSRPIAGGHDRSALAAILAGGYRLEDDKQLTRLETIRFSRFVLTGGASAAAYFVVSVTLDSLELPSWVSVTFGRACAILVAYFGQLYFVFQMPADHRRMIWRFSVSRVLNWLVSLLITYGVHDAAGFPFWLASVLVVVITPVVSWPVSRYWVFRDNGRADER